jgi:hypothetical protein
MARTRATRPPARSSPRVSAPARGKGAWEDGRQARGRERGHRHHARAHRGPGHRHHPGEHDRQGDERCQRAEAALSERRDGHGIDDPEQRDHRARQATLGTDAGCGIRDQRGEREARHHQQADHAAGGVGSGLAGEGLKEPGQQGEDAGSGRSGAGDTEPGADPAVPPRVPQRGGVAAERAQLAAVQAGGQTRVEGARQGSCSRGSEPGDQKGPPRPRGWRSAVAPRQARWGPERGSRRGEARGRHGGDRGPGRAPGTR